MDICHSIENLLQNDFDLLFFRFVLFVSDEFLQIEIVKIKYDLQHLFLGFVHDVDKRYDIGMLLECFEERDLSES